MLAHNPVARFMFPKMLDRAHRRLLALATENPDLAKAYKARAELFAERIRIFDPAAAIRLFKRRRAEAIDIMDRMDRTLADDRAVMAPPAYGIADTVLTVFLARMEFVGLSADVAKRPALVRYWRVMQARPSFAAADVWTKPHPARMIGAILGFGRR